MNQPSAIEIFTGQFESERNITALKRYLGKETSVDDFTAVVIRAVQENPELLQAEPKSLFFACQRAAQDKLMPDGKEGYLGTYSTNVGTRDKPQWVKKVQWHPMIEGMRKILAANGIMLTAELVYEKDLEDGRFIVEKGDNPCIIHRPNVFADRGKMVGAYAIVTDRNTGEVLGRETMNLQQLEQVRAASKNPNGSVWKSWADEMYRKAPARRLFKQTPRVSNLLKSVIESDNETYDLDKPQQLSGAAQAVQNHIRLAAPNAENKVPQQKVQQPEPFTIDGNEPDEAFSQTNWQEPERDDEMEIPGQEPDF